MPGPLFGKRILITAGPTREHLDPVRYLSNASSGAMGVELATVLRRQGAHVILVCGPTTLPLPTHLKVVHVTTALEMFEAVKKRLPTVNAFISTAAVSDWRFLKMRSQKIKKGKEDIMGVFMKKNPDILSEAGRFKKNKKREGPLLVGFSLETQKLENFAYQKMREKNLDLIIGNTPQSFAGRFIRPLWIERSGFKKWWPRITKRKLSFLIARWLKGQFDGTS